MLTPDALRRSRIALHHGTGAIPVAGFGTLIPDPVADRRCHQDGTGSWLPTPGLRGTLPQRRRGGRCAAASRSQQGVVERADVFVTTKLWNTNHRPERVGPGVRRKPWPTAPRLHRLLSHPHALRVRARRRPRPARRTRPGDLRRRGHVGGDLARVGAPRRRRPLPIDRTVQRIAASVARHRRGCADQARRRAGRVPPVSAGMGAARLLPKQGIVLQAFAALGHR